MLRIRNMEVTSLVALLLSFSCYEHKPMSQLPQSAPLPSKSTSDPERHLSGEELLSIYCTCGYEPGQRVTRGQAICIANQIQRCTDTEGWQIELWPPGVYEVQCCNGDNPNNGIHFAIDARNGNIDGILPCNLLKTD